MQCVWGGDDVGLHSAGVPGGVGGGHCGHQEHTTQGSGCDGWGGG